MSCTCTLANFVLNEYILLANRPCCIHVVQMCVAMTIPLFECLLSHLASGTFHFLRNSCLLCIRHLVDSVTGVQSVWPSYAPQSSRVTTPCKVK